MPIYLISEQSRFVTNSPVSFIFNFWSRDMSLDYDETLKHNEISRLTFVENFILV